MALVERSEPALYRQFPARGHGPNNERNWQMLSVATSRSMSAVRVAGLRNGNLKLVERRATPVPRFLLTSLQRMAAFWSANRMSAVGVGGECR